MSVEKEDCQEIRIQENTNLLAIGAVPRLLTVVLGQDLVDSCKAGENITIVGRIITRWRPCKSGQRPELEHCLVANNVLIANQSVAAIRQQTTEWSNRFWAKHKNCPFEGRDLLTKSFCSQIYGLHLVKLAILLTIIAGCDDNGEGNKVVDVVGGGARKHRREGHLLLVGDPGTAKSQFLVAAAKLSPRSVMTTGSGSTSAGLTVAAVKEAGSWQLEAGALVLADGGICCIDEFNALRPHDRTAIHEAMEQQTLSVAKAGLVCMLSTRCSIIGACNAKGAFEEGEPMSANVALASPLLSRFDLILVMQDRRSAEWDHELSTAILSNATVTRSGTSTPIIDLAQLRAYLIMVRHSCSPTMSVEARVVLGKYYQLQRRADIRDAARTTIRLLESLIRLAQAHAKLMHNARVEISDAIWAIVLMETSLATQSLLPKRPDLYAAAPEDPVQQYNEYEDLILKKLEINPKIFQTLGENENMMINVGIDKDADRILCSWATSPNQ